MTIKKILAAVDNSKCAEMSVRFAFELASSVGATVLLLYVIDISRNEGSVDAGISELEAAISAANVAEKTLEEFLKLSSDSGTGKLVVEGHPQHEILAIAESEQADMIVIGRNVDKGRMQFLFGNVVEYIISHSRLPVMVIPCGKKL